MYYIYEIRNKLHRTSYIGRTSNFNARVSSHKSNLRAGTHECIMMQREYIERYMHYNILATTDDIEIAKKLENLFIYKVISHRGKIYNKIQVSFPTKLALLNDKTINCYIDSRTKKICLILFLITKAIVWKFLPITKSVFRQRW